MRTPTRNNGLAQVVEMLWIAAELPVDHAARPHVVAALQETPRMTLHVSLVQMGGVGNDWKVVADDGFIFALCFPLEVLRDRVRSMLEVGTEVGIDLVVSEHPLETCDACGQPLTGGGS